MGITVSRDASQLMIDQDLTWLEDLMNKYDPNSLEGKHIIDCLKSMPDLIYK